MMFVFVVGILLFVLLLACRYGASRYRDFSGKYEILLSCREPAPEIQIAKRLFAALNGCGLRVFWDRNRVPLVHSPFDRCTIVILIIGVDSLSSADCLLELYEVVSSDRPELLTVPVLCGGNALLNKIAQIPDPQLREAILHVVESPQRVVMPSVFDPFYSIDYTTRRVVHQVLLLLKDPPRKGIREWIRLFLLEPAASR